MSSTLPDWVVPELSGVDRAVIENTEYGTAAPLGANPALILVDFQYAYLGRDESLLAQLADYPSGGGTAAWNALRTMRPLAEVARLAGLPVVVSRIAYDIDEEASSGFAAKRGSSPQFIDGSTGASFPPELEIGADDILVTKHAASCFHGTDLHERLQARGVDTVLVAGLSTSGCVRATAVDAASLGYRVGVITDGTADRIDLSRRVALFDIWLKYGELLTAREAAAYIYGTDKTVLSEGESIHG